MDRAGLADFLRRHRSRLQPADVGLPPGRRRRTPGLRRDEVAVLASMSTDYYTRLEQARGPHPSVTLLSALARALRMSDDERDHLFHLADQVPPARHSTGDHVSPGLLHVLDRLTDTPAFVVSDTGECLVQNAMSAALSGAEVGVNHRRNWFLSPSSTRARFPREDWATHSRTHVADLRATYGRRRGDADVEALVAELLEYEEFRTLWEQHEVAVRRADRKRIIHPEAGVVDLLCETLHSGVGDQTLVVLFPRPGTEAREQLELIRVIGTQSFVTLA